MDSDQVPDGTHLSQSMRKMKEFIFLEVPTIKVEVVEVNSFVWTSILILYLASYLKLNKF